MDQLNLAQCFTSNTFPGHYYRFGEKIGSGGSGNVYQVYLKDTQTHLVKRLFAGKIILESYLLQKSTEKRRKNLSREIDILSTVDSSASVRLVELIDTEPSGTIIIQDFANGGSLYSLMETRALHGQVISEREAQKIIK